MASFDRSHHNGPIRIMVVEDHLITRIGLISVFSTVEDMVVVAEAANGVQAVEMHRLHQPDVTLMDLRLPEMGGLDALSAILEHSPQARVVILTTFDGDGDIARAMRMGAAGYLLKDAYIEEILKAIRQVHQGKKYFSGEVAARLLEFQSAEVLTERELEILSHISKGHSNRETADALFIAEQTVKNHLKNIFGKLGVNDRVSAANLAFQRGLVRPD